MAGSSKDEFQDEEKEDFEFIQKICCLRPNRLLKSFESLQCELELDYEVLSVAELYEDDQSEKRKIPDKRLDEIKGTSWSKYAVNLTRYAKNGGKYKILSEYLEYGRYRAMTCDSNWKLALNFLIASNNEISKINYKRVGHTPTEPVTWREINLGLVEATVLLCLLSDKLEVMFKKFLPIPHETKPFIIVFSDQRILPLFGEGEFKNFKNKDFDEALVAFLDCIKQLSVAIKEVTPEQRIPHNIENDKLVERDTERQFSVSLQQAPDDKHWTKAMSFLLNNLQWLSKWVTLYAHKLEPFPTPEFMEYLMKRNHKQ